MKALLPHTCSVLSHRVCYRFVSPTAHSVGIIKSNGAHAVARNNFNRRALCVLYFLHVGSPYVRLRKQLKAQKKREAFYDESYTGCRKFDTFILAT